MSHWNQASNEIIKCNFLLIIIYIYIVIHIGSPGCTHSPAQQVHHAVLPRRTLPSQHALLVAARLGVNRDAVHSTLRKYPNKALFPKQLFTKSDTKIQQEISHMIMYSCAHKFTYPGRNWDFFGHFSKNMNDKRKTFFSLMVHHKRL